MPRRTTPDNFLQVVILLIEIHAHDVGNRNYILLLFLQYAPGFLCVHGQLWWAHFYLILHYENRAHPTFPDNFSRIAIILLF